MQYVMSAHSMLCLVDDYYVEGIKQHGTTTIPSRQTADDTHRLYSSHCSTKH